MHRKICAVTVGLFFLSLAGMRIGFCQQPPAEMSVEKVRGNIYVVKGGQGANTGFFIGEQEVLVIDAKMTAESTGRMIAEIKKLTPNPVTKLVLTHSDGDHVNGLGGFPRGLEIISQARAKADMLEAFQATELQSLRPWLPNKTFTDRMSLRLGSQTVELIHHGPAHTSGDASVFFPAERVAFVGDLVFMDREPLIHRHKNGTSIGLVTYLKALLQLEADQYVAGHTAVLSKSDVESAMKGIEERQAKIKSMIAAGKSLDDIKSAFGVGGSAAKSRGGRRPGLVEVIYLDLTAKK